MNTGAIFSSALISCNTKHAAIRAIKYTNKTIVNLKQNKSSLPILTKYTKICYSLTFENVSKQKANEFRTFMTLSKNSHKTIHKFETSSKEIIPINLKSLSNLEHVSIDIEIRRSSSKISTFNKYTLLRSVTLSPKLKSIKISPFTWERCQRLARYRDLLQFDLKSSLTDFLESKDAINNYCDVKANFSSTKYNLSFFLESDQSVTVPEENLPILGRTESLSLKTNGNRVQEVPLISDSSSYVFRNLKSLSYIENGAGILGNPQALSCFSKLPNLKKLDLEFFVTPEIKPNIFDHLVLPASLRDLKMIFSNCRFTTLEEAKPQQAFFISLSKMKGLKSFEFEAFRLSLLKEPKETCIEFVRNILRSLDCQLDVLKIKGPPSQETDDEIYQLILKHTHLKVLDYGLTIKPSEAMVSKMSEFRGCLKTLNLYNNPSMFSGLSTSSMRNLEELYIYYGVHVQPKVGGNQTERFIGLLKKIKEIKSLKTLNLYFSLNAENDQKQLVETLQDMLSALKNIKSFSFVMRTLKVSEEEKAKLEKSFLWNKNLATGAMRFFNIEIGKNMEKSYSN